MLTRKKRKPHQPRAPVLIFQKGLTFESFRAIVSLIPSQNYQISRNPYFVVNRNEVEAVLPVPSNRRDVLSEPFHNYIQLISGIIETMGNRNVQNRNQGVSITQKSPVFGA